MASTKLKLGMIGLGQRGFGLLSTLVLFDNVQIVALSDCYQDRIDRANKVITEKGGKAAKGYPDCRGLLADQEVQAVIVASSWETHADIAIACLVAKKITALEVGGALSVEDCWKLVDTVESTGTPFMFLENCCYDKQELMITNMVRHGLFGEIVYCSGAYSHDLRDEILGGNINRHYRLNNYLHRNCENYPTHQLGPIAKILNINRGNRMVSLVSVASKSAGLRSYIRRNKDKVDERVHDATFRQGDIVNTIITCSDGATILLTLDTTLPTVYDRQLLIKGTEGMFNQSNNYAVLDSDEKGEEHWTGIENSMAHINSAVKYEEEYLPDFWKNITDQDRETGHGGMDGFILHAFVDCALHGKDMPIDVYDAASWMSITALSEQSIALGNMPVAIPDFTRGKWMSRKSKDVIDF